MRVARGMRRLTGVAEGANGEIEVGEGVLERDAVGDGEGAFEEWARDFKADEVVEGLRR